MEKKAIFTKRLLVIGGGAAGFFTAVNAARLAPGLEVIIAEKTGKLLSKVRVSGGGRCNITHACFDRAELVKRYPRGGNFLKKAFYEFYTVDTVNWFQSRGLALKTEADGRMFPVTDSSQSVIDCLMQEANRYHVALRLNREVSSVKKNAEKFMVDFTNGEQLEADFVCIACGGYPKTALFNWIVQTGHQIEPPVPSLFTFNMPGNPITALMGVVADPVQVKITGSKLVQEGPLLITHWGISGPAVLKLSAWGARELAALNWHFTIQINWLPQYHEDLMRSTIRELREGQAAQKIAGKNPFGLPARLWEFLLEQAGVKPAWRWGDLPAREQNVLAKKLCAFEAAVKGKTGFKEEFVTAGGVKLNEVNPQNLMSKICDKLYFAGEILDVDGITGGFNFQHAWTSGALAARSIAAAANQANQ